MVCYYPLKGWRSATRSDTGKRPITFNRKNALVDRPMTVPCGNCIGCRISRSKQWAIRCYHEAQMHQENCFLTLTYNDEHLPEDLSVNVKHFQLFMKRLRKAYPDKKIRYFHCGEYGEKQGRPHYHAIIFGHDFEDKTLWNERNGHKRYVSDKLQELWPYGFCLVGAVTYQSSAYVARYIMKKITGEQANEHYEWTDEYGVVHKRSPEYITMSLKPAIASTWLHKYGEEVYPCDYIIINGNKQPVPRYYDKNLEIFDKDLHQKIKGARIRKAKTQEENNTPDRLAIRETVQKSRLEQLPRNLE